MAAVLYKVDSLYHYGSGDVVLPDVMYKTQPFLDRNISAVTEDLKNLKARQDQLIHQLDCLLKDVSLLTNGGVNHEKSMQAQVSSASTVVTDIVIHANPADPPLSLKYFVQLLRKQSKVLLKCHLHSSLISAKIPNWWPNEDCTDRSQYEIIITVIWSNVADLSVHVNPSVHAAIHGETNLARLLGRFLKMYDSNDAFSSCSATDAYLDACDVLSTPSSREKKEVLDLLDTVLGQQSWLGGKAFAMADAVLMSTLSKFAGNAPYANIKKWQEAALAFLEHDFTLK